MSETQIRDVSMAELRALLADLLSSQRETEQRFKETDQQIKATDQRIKATDQQIKATDRQIRELGKQLGGLGNKFGSFTEGLALPSMEKILRRRFGMEVVSPSVRATKGGEELEIDVLAYANGEINTAYVVEVKSHLREESIEQMTNILRRFAFFFPEHRGKRVYGILAAVHLPKAMKAKALSQGLYVARIHDDVFQLETPEQFQALDFGGQGL